MAGHDSGISPRRISWAPAFPLDQILGDAFPYPLLGDGLGREDLVTLVVHILAVLGRK